MLVLRRLLLVAGILMISVPASATPVTYGYTAGSFTVQARQSSDNALVFDETIAMSSDSFLVFDAAGVPQIGGPGSIDDFLLRSVPNQGAFSTIQPYGPFDQITIDMADIIPDLGAGYDTLLYFPSGGSTFQFQAGAVDIDAWYSATNSTTSATSGSTQADIINVTNMSGTATFSAGTIQLEIAGIVMGKLDGSAFGETGNDLNLTANIVLFADSNVVPTPEPSTALLVSLGLLGMAAGRRRFSA